MDPSMLEELETTLRREMPICEAMGIRAISWEEQRLTMTMPLDANKNHQYSAFAGSLNALCTVVGWGTVYLLLCGRGLSGNIVIRRSSVRYKRPVRCDLIAARTKPLEASAVGYFFELLESKGRSKLDLSVDIIDAAGSQVAFTGSYVVQD